MIGPIGALLATAASLLLLLAGGLRAGSPVEIVPGAGLMQKPDAFGCNLGDYV